MLQVKEVLTSVADTTIEYDGTEKSGQHYADIQISTTDVTLTTGIVELPSGTAASYNTAIMENIAATERTEHPIDCGSEVNVLKNISNTMTDRHIVNKKTNSMLREAKEEVCGSDITWNNFYCSLA